MPLVMSRIGGVNMDWQDILKIRKPTKAHEEAKRVRERFEEQESNKPKFEFSFKKNYTYDEFYNLLDSEIKNKMERLAKKGSNILSQEYRIAQMDKRESREFSRSGKMPSPYTLEEVKDRISIKLKEDIKKPSIQSEFGSITITLPYSKTDSGPDLISDALDELYDKFGKNVKQNKKKKWYQEYRRGKGAREVRSYLSSDKLERPDFDADEEELEYFRDMMFGLLGGDDPVKIRSGKI
jgi:hypothetical protein